MLEEWRKPGEADIGPSLVYREVTRSGHRPIEQRERRTEPRICAMGRQVWNQRKVFVEGVCWLLSYINLGVLLCMLLKNL